MHQVDLKKFYQYEYYRKSSMASAIRAKERCAVKMPGADKAWGELTEEVKSRIERWEHIRWNAYMRSEGYRFGKRNDLANYHQELVSFEELKPEEKGKDSIMWV